MVRAYLRINVAAGKEREVREALNDLVGVKSADLTAGEQDIIAIVEGTTYEDILKNVLNNLRNLEGIIGTTTSLVLE